MEELQSMPTFKRKLEICTVKSRSKTTKRRLIDEQQKFVEEEEDSSRCSSTTSCEEEEGDKEEVEKKILALQRMVPGGETLAVDKLFEETAGYILALQSQIKALRVLNSFIQGLEKQNRKLGG